MLPQNLRNMFLQSSGVDEFFGAGAVPVNESTAVTSSAVWSAVNLLASQVAQLPLHVSGNDLFHLARDIDALDATPGEECLPSPA